ncbi:hypothetical protein [Bounagaea algeriensis]
MSTVEFASPVPDFALGVHGVLRWHQWVVDSHRRGGFPEPDDEAVFAVTNSRAEALDLVIHGTNWNPMARWGSEEAGGDWTQDGRVRELAWMQARPLNLAYQGWPVWPGLACLHDGLQRVGTVELAGVHAVLPLQMETHHRGNFPDIYEWFELSEEAAPRREFAVSLYAEGERACDPQQLRQAVHRRAGVLLDVQLAEQPAAEFGDPEQLEGRWMFDGELHGVHLRCRGPEWSLDMAAFTVDVLAYAAEQIGIEQLVMLTVFRADGETASGSAEGASRRPVTGHRGVMSDTM